MLHVFPWYIDNAYHVSKVKGFLNFCVYWFAVTPIFLCKPSPIFEHVIVAPCFTQNVSKNSKFYQRYDFDDSESDL